MAVTITLEEQTLEETFESILQAIRRERDRTETEYEAFEEFVTRVADIQPSNPPLTRNPATEWLDAAGGTGALESRPLSASPTTDPLAAIRDAYEETVMSVPFYDTEYGDTYTESLYEEFGQEVAIAVTHGSEFTPTVKQLLLAKVEKAQAGREALIDTCEREHGSVNEMATVLKPIHDELQSFESSPLDEQGFGTLDAYRTRLLTISDKCEQAAVTRQATINHHRTEFDFPVEAPDIGAYLYKTFETAYPILVLCSELARRIEDYRHQVEHAMSSRPN